MGWGWGAITWGRDLFHNDPGCRIKPSIGVIYVASKASAFHQHQLDPFGTRCEWALPRPLAHAREAGLSDDVESLLLEHGCVDGGGVGALVPIHGEVPSHAAEGARDPQVAIPRDLQPRVVLLLIDVTTLCSEDTYTCKVNTSPQS